MNQLGIKLNTVNTIENLGSTLSSANRVPENLLTQLREHGMHCPIRGLNDPRLQYPELLIASGWERLDVTDGYAYRYSADEDNDGPDKFEQTFEAHEDNSRTLTTTCGKTEHTIEKDNRGTVTSSVRELKATPQRSASQPPMASTPDLRMLARPNFLFK